MPGGTLVCTDRARTRHRFYSCQFGANLRSIKITDPPDAPVIKASRPLISLSTDMLGGPWLEVGI